MKRFFDMLLSCIALMLLLPILLTVALIIWIWLGRPIFFRQMRPGQHGEPFQIIKFRSMLSGIDKDGSMLSDEQRLTKFGRLLRASSLDELPGLWNVLKGDMSLVGPRPLLMDYLPLYNNQQARRHEVRPGITGWAQVNGRNAITWEEKFELDVWYVDHRSLRLDLWIILLTIKKVLQGSDINSAGAATMPGFSGSIHEDISCNGQHGG